MVRGVTKEEEVSGVRR
jgi:hypothetical protein